MDRDPQARWRTWVVAIGLVALVAAVFGRALWNDFVGIDTATYLTGNRRVLSGLSADGIAWAFTTFHGANWHPLTWLSHMLDVSLFGLAPAGHHAVNVALHAANSCLVFLVLQRWTARSGPSFAVAALFAVHPLHVESVAWIVERKDLLAAFFGLASLLAWTGWARERSKGAYAGALILFAAALMSKPMLVTLPFALLVFDVWPLRRVSLGWGRLVLEKLPFFVLAIASCVVTVLAQRAGGAMQGLEGLPLVPRVENAIAAYGWYVAKIFWPAGLSFHYPLPSAGSGVPGVALGVLVVLGASVLAFVQRRRRPWLMAGWLVFAGMLVPVIGLVQVGGQAHADRYVYLPILGILVALVWTVEELVADKRTARALAWIFVIAFAVLARQQVATWRNDETLARRALAIDPRNAVAHDILGVSLFGKGRVAEGLAHLQQAVEIQPGDADARLNLGRALMRIGRDAEAEQELRQAAALRPRDGHTLAELGALLARQGSLSEALGLLALAAQVEPDDVDVRLAHGEALHRAGSIVAAEREYRAALALDPRSLKANVDLARALIETARGDEAEPHLRRALAVDAQNPQALQQLSLVLAARGEHAEAVRALRKALLARSDWPQALADLAWILATAPDASVRSAPESLALATRALNPVTRERAAFLDVLAAAQAANGRFDEAVRTALAAAQRARQSGDAALAARIEQRLAAYRENRMETGGER